jgi:subtilisin-like proprotein convertase family protein
MPFRACLATRFAVVVACVVAPSIARAQVNFTNNDPITIPAGGEATPFPSTITVAGYTGPITAITVTLTGFSHAYTDDLTAVLTGPGGQQTMLFSGAGKDSPADPGTNVTGLTLTFSDAPELQSLPINSDFTSGTYRPGLNQYGDTLSPPHPPGPYADSFEDFLGQEPDGTYSLYVEDSFAGTGGSDGGSITSWSIDISGITPVPEPMVLGVAAAGLGAVAWIRRRSDPASTPSAKAAPAGR